MKIIDILELIISSNYCQNIFHKVSLNYFYVIIQMKYYTEDANLFFCIESVF